MHGIWSIWMRAWCWGMLAFGALLVTAAIPGLDGAVRALYVLFSANPSNAAAFDHSATRFGLGLQGALTIGWGLTILTLLSAARAAGAPLWRGLTGALLVWYVIDSAISIATGFWPNAVSNTVLMAAFAYPVFAAGVLRSTR